MKSKSLTTTDKNLLPLITPGEFLAEEFMEPLGLSANALAAALQVPANRISMIVNGRRGITADTAVRLAQFFDTSPEFWMNLQQAYELDRARREPIPVIRKFTLTRKHEKLAQ